MTDLQILKIKIIAACIVASVVYLLVCDVIAWLIYGGKPEEYERGEMLNNRFCVAIAPIALLILLFAKVWQIILGMFHYFKINEEPSKNFTEYIP